MSIERISFYLLSCLHFELGNKHSAQVDLVIMKLFVTVLLVSCLFFIRSDGLKCEKKHEVFHDAKFGKDGYCVMGCKAGKLQR